MAAPARPSTDHTATLVAARDWSGARGLFQRPYKLTALVVPPRVAAEATSSPRSASPLRGVRARNPSVTPP